MHDKLLFTILVLSTVSACDKDLDDLERAHPGSTCGDQGHHGQPGDSGESSDSGDSGTGGAESDVHPYLTCDAPNQYADQLDPVCEIGCGMFGNDEGGYMLCGIPCETEADCAFASGDGGVLCEDRCYLLCASDSDCPEGLACVDMGPGDTNECMAPYTE